MVLALDYCHKRGVVIRDIKLENTLLNFSAQGKPLVKICDFGFTKSVDSGAPHTKLGTMSYTAPEVISSGVNGKAYNGEISDVWSLGVMLYVMLFFTYPFEADENGCVTMHALRCIHRGQYELPDRLENGDTSSESCKGLLQQMLIAEPATRITISEIQKHPWFCQGLPSSLTGFNDQLLQKQEKENNQHTANKILQLVRQARHSSS